MLKDFKENEKRTEKVLVLGVEEKKTARGSAFIVCSVTDGETKLEVKFWNTTKLMFEMFIHKVVTPNEIVEQLEHIIASHHGKYEYGAIALPATKEAEIVYMLDMADSRIYMYEEAYKKVEPGEMSDYVKGLDKSVIKF